MITNSNDNTLVGGSKGSDTIVNYGNYVTVKANAGNDWVGEYGKNSVILADTGNDTVYGLGENVSIDAGKGNDLVWISNTSGWSTVKSGAGKDTIGIDLRSNYDYETGTGVS